VTTSVGISIFSKEIFSFVEMKDWHVPFRPKRSVVEESQKHKNSLPKQGILYFYVSLKTATATEN